MLVSPRKNSTIPVGIVVFLGNDFSLGAIVLRCNTKASRWQTKVSSARQSQRGIACCSFRREGRSFRAADLATGLRRKRGSRGNRNAVEMAETRLTSGKQTFLSAGNNSDEDDRLFRIYFVGVKLLLERRFPPAV